MSVARTGTQRLLQSSVLHALAILVGSLRLDRFFEVTWRWFRRRELRMLTPLEIHEAVRVFGNSIPYEDVRVVERSPFALRVVALSNRVHLPQDRGLAVTVFKTIHFTGQLKPDNADMPWLVHELTHVWQYCQLGPRYLTDALRAQAQRGDEAYDIRQGVVEGWAWDAFNAEQQGNIARAYYRALITEADVTAFEPYVQLLRSALTTRKSERIR